MYTVYVLRSLSTGRHYVGFAADVVQRLGPVPALAVPENLQGATFSDWTRKGGQVISVP